MRNFFLLLMLFQVSLSANAGYKKFTMYSRANCVNNESISWQAHYSFNLRTISRHYYGHELAHIVDTGWEYTWRSAAVHWGEGRGGWFVVGLHYQIINGHAVLLAQTAVPDCSIYDGWWD